MDSENKEHLLREILARLGYDLDELTPLEINRILAEYADKTKKNQSNSNAGTASGL